MNVGAARLRDALFDGLARSCALCATSSIIVYSILDTGIPSISFIHRSLGHIRGIVALDSVSESITRYFQYLMCTE